ncbi:hypothetical protein [Marinobacter alkaliphilus]|uniref:Uncharacterized protein n=1 Tax=Marinobacter alkaliphilus TaxID=254719 RepID=A0ABZ3E7W0_9GAMM
MAVNAEIVAWNRQAAEALALARATPADLDEWRQEVAEGLAQLWQITGESTGYLLTRVEQDRAGRRELVLVAGAGNNARAVIAWAGDLADRHGLDMRTHIERRGLERLYQRAGWHRSEIVMRRNYGQ